MLKKTKTQQFPQGEYVTASFDMANAQHNLLISGLNERVTERVLREDKKS